MGRPVAGTDVAGYQLEELLGRGGMGEVHRALDVRLGRPVALKLLAPSAAGEALLRESRLAAGLDHPNVIPIYEAGERDGRLFIAMRYVGDGDLKGLLRREGALDPGRAIAIAAQVGDALDAAHARGLVHRDVKPSNVLLDHQHGREHCYLADFGLTQSASERGPADGQFMGTIDYVAPEQIRGDPLDGRADQ
jgi:serine/threonine protein kinase